MAPGRRQTPWPAFKAEHGLLFTRPLPIAWSIGLRELATKRATGSSAGGLRADPLAFPSINSTLMVAPPHPIATPRLSLRPFDLADASDLYAIRGDSQAMSFRDWPADQTEHQTLEVARRLVRDMKAGAAIYWTARDPSGEFIGVFDLSELASTSAELGFMIARRHWGQGYATEAAGALIEDSRRRGLRHLSARIHAGNDASRRLLCKLGFHAADADAVVEVAPGRSVPCTFFRLDLWPA